MTPFVNVLWPATGGEAYYEKDTTSEWAHTPSTTALHNFPASDFEIRVRMAPADWASGTQYFLGKAEVSAGVPTSGWFFRLQSTGQPRFGFAHSGGSALLTAVDAVTHTDGSPGWVRLVRDDVNFVFYESEDGESWTQLGAPNAAAETNVVTNTETLAIGAYRGAGSLAMGDSQFYRAQIWDGHAGDGTLIMDFDPLEATPGTPEDFTAATGEVWTFEGSEYRIVHE